MPISKPHSTLGATNIGSCSKLTLYLDKENQELEKMINKSNTIGEISFLENRKQHFFNSGKFGISCIEVIDSIDQNVKKLGKNDSKYFAPTISFSQLELEHLVSIATNGKKVKDVWEMNAGQFKSFNELVREYIKLVMTNYAKNFNREEKGLVSGNDLVYFAKIEHFRKFKGTDKDVKKGLIKNGSIKPGLNTHVHIVVSRKDKSQKLKLTPTTKERLTDRKIGDNSYRVGFDRVKWINMNEKTFDKLFKYNRPLIEKFENQFILKNGSPKEKDDLLKQIDIENQLASQTIKTQKNAQNNTYNASKGRGW